ncbi:MAG: hypothetical protein AAGE52_01615 [Myxococcota bacterium]
MSRSSRDKGKRGELEVVAAFKEIGAPAYRSGSAQRASGSKVADVEGTAFWVEVCRSAGTSHFAKMRQAVRDRDIAEDPRMPVVFKRQDRGEWLVTMRAEDWMRLVTSGVPMIVGGEE